MPRIESSSSSAHAARSRREVGQPISVSAVSVTGMGLGPEKDLRTADLTVSDVVGVRVGFGVLVDIVRRC